MGPCRRAGKQRPEGPPPGRGRALAQRSGAAADSRLTFLLRAEAGPRLCPVNLHNFQPLARLQVALAAKPVFHGRLKALERDARPGFEHSVGHRQRVIEDWIVGEVAHGKVVDPANRARVPDAAHINPLNGKPAREHPSNVMDAGRRGVHPRANPNRRRTLFRSRYLCAFPLLASTRKRL